MIDDVVGKLDIVGPWIDEKGVSPGLATGIMGDDVVLDLDEPWLGYRSMRCRAGCWINITAVENNVAGGRSWPRKHTALAATDLKRDRIIDKQIVENGPTRSKLRTTGGRVGKDVANGCRWATGILDVEFLIENGWIRTWNGGVPSIVIKDILLKN